MDDRASHVERKRQRDLVRLPKNIQNEINNQLGDVDDPMGTANWIFSSFKSLHHDDPIVRLVSAVNDRNNSLWKEAGRMTTQAVWKLVLRDCIIPRQDEWIRILRSAHGGNGSDQVSLEVLCERMDFFKMRVKLLKECAPVPIAPDSYPCKIVALIDINYGQINDRRLRQAQTQRPTEDEMIAQIESILTETIKDLKTIFHSFPKVDFANAAEAELGQESMPSHTGTGSLVGDPSNLSATGTLQTSWSSLGHGSLQSLAASLTTPLDLGKVAVDTADSIPRVRTPGSDWSSNVSEGSGYRSSSISSVSSNSSKSSLSSADTEHSWADIDAVCKRIDNHL